MAPPANNDFFIVALIVRILSFKHKATNVRYGAPELITLMIQGYIYSTSASKYYVFCKIALSAGCNTDNAHILQT